MRRVTLLCCAAFALACARSENVPADTAAATGTVAPTLTLADVQGTWNVRGMREGSDSTLVTYVIDATRDPSAWTLTFPNRDPIPLRVAFGGDSVVIDGGPFESVLRPGVQVTSHSVSRLQDGKLIGTTTARYAGAGADSVLVLRTEGTRGN